MFKASDYLITPIDAVHAVRNALTRTTARDVIGTAITLGIIGGTKYAMGLSIESSLFLAFTFALFYWRKNSRFSFSLALVCLILIPVLLILFTKNILLYGELWADTVAVWAYYFLVIGVLQEIAIHIRDSIRGKKRSNQIVTDIRKPS